MDTQRICPSCGKKLASDAPQGLCPECLIKAGFDTGSGPGETAGPAFVPLSVEAVAALFPQLEILKLIGVGGMGAVYQARQPALDRLVALKLLPTRSANDPGFAERFAREARALAKLAHPNIVAVYDFGQVHGLHYFIMEYIDGANLRQLQRATLSSRDALQIIPQICEALQFAHDEGVVHRDIKPENVLLDKKGRVKIADFGLAKILGREPSHLRLTGAKDVMGTPHYMAPEQIERPREVDHRADIYSLGVVFYEMLTGELPLGRFAPPSQKAQIDVRLDEVVLRALEKEPERRYQHASEVKTDLETISTTQGPAKAGLAKSANKSTISRRTIAWVALGIFVFVLLSFLNLQKHSASLPVSRPVTLLKTFTTNDIPISGDLHLTEDHAWAATCSSTQTFRLFEVSDPGIENCILMYQARLKTEGLAGRTYLEMWLHFPALGDSFSRGLDNAPSGSNDWAAYETPFYLKAGERPDRIRLNLVIEGKGRVLIKDVSLRTAPLN